MSGDLKELYNFVIGLAKDAGALILKRREEGDLAAQFKTPRDLVTEADLECEKFIISKIKERYPEDPILAEESHSTLELSRDYKGRFWIIDPIDGTTNFARGHMHACVSIALCVDAELQVGVVYSPFQNELFSAYRGGGAFLNGSFISVSKTSELKRSLVVTGRPKELKDTPEFLKMVEWVIHSCHDFRRLGSAALDICWVACGRVEGFFESLNPWDIAAACLIASEAGAKRSHLRPVAPDFSLPLGLYATDLLIAAPGISAALKEGLSKEL